ncbi:MAG: hypothetical protein HY905_15735 [Deltaproteobacteria bacterium]|nr:hypothetical protein [Deltaproteobacteria bacterium]
MRRTMKGRDGREHTCECRVTANGFLYCNDLYDTPTPVATRFVIEVLGHAAGTRRAGFRFFFPHSAASR